MLWTVWTPNNVQFQPLPARCDITNCVICNEHRETATVVFHLGAAKYYNTAMLCQREVGGSISFVTAKNTVAPF